LVLGFGNLGDHEVEEAVRRLAEAVQVDWLGDRAP
jgi:hypothetical protein